MVVTFPTRISPLGTSAFRESFLNFTEVSKCQKNGAITRAPFFSAITGEPKKGFFSFLTIYDKNTGHRVTKFYPDTHTSNTYKFYFINFFLTRKKYFCFLYIQYRELFCHRRRLGVVGKAAGSKFEISGSSLPAANLFLFFSPEKSSAFAEDGGFWKVFFGQKAPHFV